MMEKGCAVVAVMKKKSGSAGRRWTLGCDTVLVLSSVKSKDSMANKFLQGNPALRAFVFG